MLIVEYYGILLQPGADGESHIRVGKLNMVDLAGSERQAKTGATVNTALTYNGVINSFIKTITFLISFWATFRQQKQKCCDGCIPLYPDSKKIVA